MPAVPIGFGSSIFAPRATVPRVWSGAFWRRHGRGDAVSVFGDRRPWRSSTRRGHRSWATAYGMFFPAIPFFRCRGAGGKPAPGRCCRNEKPPIDRASGRQARCPEELDDFFLPIVQLLTEGYSPWRRNIVHLARPRRARGLLWSLPGLQAAQGRPAAHFVALGRPAARSLAEVNIGARAASGGVPSASRAPMSALFSRRRSTRPHAFPGLAVEGASPRSSRLSMSLHPGQRALSLSTSPAFALVDFFPAPSGQRFDLWA
jgi:hypothetical protein